MEIKKRNTFVEFLKKYGVYLGIGVAVFTIILTFTLVASLSSSKTVSNKDLSFAMPMKNAVVVKDYSSTELQNNQTLNQWEAHLGIDLSSESNEVYSVLDGVVKKIEYDYLKGYIISIAHADGFVSVYSSLDKNLSVKEGDKIAKGDKIGLASESSSAEQSVGKHLHFELFLKGKSVDPNNYLDLQVK